MSEQWRGLHNPERHYAKSETDTHCRLCREYCDEGGGVSYCRCCLAAEVEALRAQVQRVRELCATVGYRGLPTEDVLRALDGDDELGAP